MKELLIKNPNKEEIKASTNAKTDMFKFVGLYIISTGVIPGNNNIRLLEKFVSLSLNQSSNGLDAEADRLVKANSNIGHSEMVMNYWPDVHKKAFRQYLEDLENVYPKNEASKENRAIKEAVASWYRTFHFQESKIRNVNPPGRRLDEQFKPVNPQNQITSYRESTNLAYTNAMLTILDPEKREENEDLYRKVLFPALMVFQTVVDFAHRGVESHIPKPTMDKLSPKKYEDMNLVRKMYELTQDCICQVKPYKDMIEFPRKITGMNLRNRLLIAANFVSYLTQLTEYQVRNKKLARYEVAS